MIRRFVVVTAVCAAALVLAECRGPRPAPRTVVLGVNDVFCEQTRSACVGQGRGRSYAGLAEELGRKIGRPVEMRYFNTEPQLVEAVRAGQLDGVICKAWTGMLAARKAGRQLHRLADLSMPDGPERLEGVFFVRTDSPIRTMADLAGKTLAVGQPGAYEKSQAVTRRLAELGIRPAEVKVVPTCVATAMAVRDGEVDAAVLSSYAFLFGTLQAVDLSAREIGRTESIPFITVAALDTLDSASRERLGKSLLELSAAVPPDLVPTRIMPASAWQPVELNEHE